MESSASPNAWSVPRIVFAVSAVVASVVLLAAFSLPDNMHRLPGACSGDRITGPNYAEWGFAVAGVLWVIAALATIGCASTERRPAWYLAMVACLAAASICGVYAVARTISSGFGC